MPFYIECFAGDTFNYSTNVALSNTMLWTGNGILTTLDMNDIFDGSNVNVGQLTANLSPISNNLPNSVNYTLNLTANSYATQTWIANSVNINERKLYLFTKFTSNTGSIVHGNSAIIIVKASYDTTNNFIANNDPESNSIFDQAPNIQ